MVVLAAAGLSISAVYLFILGREIGSTFEGSLWNLPSRVYSAPLRLRRGERAGQDLVRSRLDLGGYARVAGSPASPGQYRAVGRTLEVYLRDFPAPDGGWSRKRVRLEFSERRVDSIQEIPSGRGLRFVDFEPQPIASFYGANREERTILPLSAYPKYLVDAVLAAEDQRFYSHHGVDPLGILRAMYENLRSRDVVQGGSTITQQTVKNLYLSSERTLGRKLKEALMAIMLEAKYPKERILEVYLNEVYLGQSGSAAICGFGEAARFYFGKDARDLDLSESAMLAGMIRAPALYNPIGHPDRALARKDLVVQQMLDQGRITGEQAKRAKAARPPLSRGSLGAPRARYAVDRIHRELDHGEVSTMLEAGGLRILTTLDPWLQAKGEEAVARGLQKLERDRPALARRREANPLESCLVALRPGTGEILALVGGRSYSESQFDRVSQAQRQPGSLFKPFVYATGFERGLQDSDRPFTPATILEDEPLSLTVGGKEWSPQNYDEEYRGTVTAREALEGSLNVPTVRAAMAIGLDRIASTAESAGMGHDLKPYPSIALGAQEVVPIDAAAAFTIFATGGIRARPFSVASVVDPKGHVVERGAPQFVKVLSPQAAYLTLDLMRGVVDRGTAAALRAHGISGDVVGKTGTTNDKRDAWFVGMRPDILVLVWVGFDDHAETHMTGAQGALPIWEDFMRSAGLDDSEAVFEKPEGIVVGEVDPTTGGLATSGCPERVEEIFIEGKLPESCPEHAEGGFRRFWKRLFGRDRKIARAPGGGDRYDRE